MSGYDSYERRDTYSTRPESYSGSSGRGSYDSRGGSSSSSYSDRGSSSGGYRGGSSYSSDRGSSSSYGGDRGRSSSSYGSDRGSSYGGNSYGGSDRGSSYGGSSSSYGGGSSYGGSYGGGSYGGGGGYDNGTFGSNLPKQRWDEELPKFEKNFYYEHPAVQQLTEQEVYKFRKDKDIVIKGNNIPKPVRSFEEASFPGMFGKAYIFLYFICILFWLLIPIFYRICY